MKKREHKDYLKLSGRNSEFRASFDEDGNLNLCIEDMLLDQEACKVLSSGQVDLLFSYIEMKRKHSDTASSILVE